MNVYLYINAYKSLSQVCVCMYVCVYVCLYIYVEGVLIAKFF